MVSSLFGGGQTVAQQPQTQQSPAVGGLKFQTSVYGGAIPLVFGQQRVPVNAIGYGRFRAIAHTTTTTQPTGGGGKGAPDNAPQSTTSTTYTYTVGIMLAACEGPIVSYGRIWLNKRKRTAPSQVGFTTFLGSRPQTPWAGRGQLAAAMAADGMGGYIGLAYMATTAFNLGTGTSLPNINVEINGLLYNASNPGAPDVNPMDIVTYLVTNQTAGLGLSASFLATTTVAKAYAEAVGIFMSAVYAEQRPAADMITEILTYANIDTTVSEGKIKFVPRGDKALTGYTPPAVVDNLTNDDLIADDNGDSVIIERKDPSDLVNVVTIECLNRAADYAPVTVRATDDALVSLLGPRPDQSRRAGIFALPSVAAISAQLLLQRQQIMERYSFRLPPQFIYLDPGDIVTLTDSTTGLSLRAVKILDIDEGDDGKLSLTAEAYGGGTGTQASTGSSGGEGANPNFDISPGEVTATAIFEPSSGYTNGEPVVCVAAAGSDENYGGCEIWMSTDGTEYGFVGKIVGKSRIGSIVGVPLASTELSSAPPTVDTLSTLRVDLSQSAGELVSVSQTDALALTTLCFVGTTPTGGPGELVAYRDATALAAANTYNLKYLVRAAFNSTLSAHAVGSKFVRFDNTVLNMPYPGERVGQEIYIKLLAFNIYGGGLQTLADVSPLTYTVLGTSVATPNPTPGVNELSADIENIYGLLGALMIGLSKTSNQQIFAPSEGNYIADAFTTISNMEVPASVGMSYSTDKKNKGFLFPANVPAALIPALEGTIIGNFGATASRAWTGAAAKAPPACATVILPNPAGSGQYAWIGKDYGGSPKSIQKISFRGSKQNFVSLNMGYGGRGQNRAGYFPPPNNQVYLRGWASNVLPTGPTAGTLCSATNQHGNVIDESVERFCNFTDRGPWRYVWGTVQIDSGPNIFLGLVRHYSTAQAANMRALSKVITPAGVVSTVMVQSILEMIDGVAVNDTLQYKVTANSSAYRPITGISKANPAVVICANHGFTTGDSVYIGGFKGMVELNGTDHTITVIGPNSFSLDGVNSAGFVTYVSGGRALKGDWTTMVMNDITGAIGGNTRSLQSAETNVIVPGQSLVFRIDTGLNTRMRVRGIQLLWK